jgi:thiamine-monophosphate kinase
MGARPRAALLSLVLPESLEVADVDRLLDGLVPLAERHGVAIVGGNITRTRGPLVIDVTATGSVKPRKVLIRGGARPGDDVFVTGSLGAAAVGLKMLQGGNPGAGRETVDLARSTVQIEPRGVNDEQRTGPLGAAGDCIERYLRPIPRVRAGMLLGRNRAATSCMDLSDGLADAAWQVAEASGVGLRIDASALPLADGVREWHTEHDDDAVETALTGGDDYELLFTCRPSHRGRLRAVRAQVGDLPITRIGVVTRGRDVVLGTPTGERPMPRGFDHFR